MEEQYREMDETPVVVNEVEAQVQDDTEKAWLSAKELINMKIDDDLWLVENIIPRKGLVGFTGPSDCGKSTFLRQLAIAIATGDEEFLGFKISSKKRQVLYVCTEDEHLGVKLVLEKQLTGLGKPEPETLFFMFDLTNEALDRFLKNHPIDLVILDVWADTYSGDPNNWQQVRKNLRGFSGIAKKHKCAIVLLHHNVKNSESSAANKNKLNGSQAIEAKLRSVMDLRMGDKPAERVMKIIKGNYIPVEEKNKLHILELDQTFLFFRKVSEQSAVLNPTVSNESSSVFDKPFWQQRMAELRAKGFSYDAGRLELLKLYERVPSKTWFVENPSDSSVDTTPAAEDEDGTETDS